MLHGRTRDTGEILRLIREQGLAPVVTIVGPPGVGKSRLAREVVERAEQEQAGSGSGLAVTIVDDADAIGIDSAIAEVEKVGGGGIALVTSRERLRLRNEVVVRIDPLPDDVAVALFEERAKRVDRSFAFEAAREILLALVKELDGLPLAIELAAERVGALSAQAILNEVVKDRLAFLRTRNRDVTGRNASLSQSIEASWNRLTIDEQVALSQCSVFAGLFSLDAARAVIASGGEEEDDAIDRVESLVDKSLIVRGPDARLSLYRCIRAFARKKSSPDVLFVAEQAHAKHFTMMMNPAIEEDEAETILAITRSNDHIASARALLALEPGLAQKGPLSSLLSLIDQQIDSDVSDAWRLRLLVGRARTLRRMGRAEDALVPLKAAADLVKDEAQQELVTLARREIEQTLGRDTGVHVPTAVDASTDVFAAVLPPKAIDLTSAKHAAEKAVQAAKKKGETRTEAIVRTRLAAYCLQAKEIDQAIDHVTFAIATHRSIGAALHEGVASYVAGLIEIERDQPETAAAFFEDVQSRARELDSSLLRGYAHRGQALLAIKMGATSLAEQELKNAAIELARAGDRVTLADVEAMSSSVTPQHVDEPVSQKSVDLTIGPTWFQLLGSEQVDLSRRRALRLMVHHLAEHRSATLDEIVKASWPGERILLAAASARVWTAIRTLRALGLRDLLVTTDTGYKLADHVNVVRHRIE